MTEDELRRRLGMYGEIPFDWIALRQSYLFSEHRPIMLNQGGDYEEPFGVTLALRWGERLAEEAL